MKSFHKITLISAIGVFLIGSTGCSKLSPGATSNASNGSTASNSGSGSGSAPAAVAETGNAATDLLNAIKAMQSAPSYSSKIVIQGETRNYTMTMEHSSPEKYHYIREGTEDAATAKLTGRRSEGIFIGDKGWLRKDDGPWKPTPAGMNFAKAMENSLDIAKKFGDEQARNADIKVTGTENLDGVSTKVYEYNGKPVMEEGDEVDPNAKIRVKFWVNSAGLPIKLEEENTRTEDGKVSTTKMSATYDYSANPSIEAPM